MAKKEEGTVTMSVGKKSVTLTDSQFKDLANGPRRPSGGSKPKAVNFELILPAGNSEIYGLLDEVREKYHEGLDGARITLAWRKALKADTDGHLILGKCVKVSDMHRELADYDFVILLNQEVWEHFEFTVEKKRALIDHELCHAAPSCDKETGEMKQDERGRQVWRIRKHDIEEFKEIVERHGCYKADLEAFAESLLKSKQLELQSH